MANYLNVDETIETLSKLMPSMSTPDGSGWGDELIGSACEMLADCIGTIKDMTPANVVEVKHAHWIYNENAIDFGIGGWVCSKCHCRNENIHSTTTESPYIWMGSQYCPHCGATMIDDKHIVTQQ